MRAPRDPEGADRDPPPHTRRDEGGRKEGRMLEKEASFHFSVSPSMPYSPVTGTRAADWITADRLHFHK
ncbi:hypothetical protein EYF80_015350 [Liparis tanakae]|uniref:Uncharacterized protein n=1 Tax=Liparis tanakae TaxID=230148 RepID=A0A4Z2I9H1_9TELE|nr:hypothetical protein EYF80_015350 [Liparis tanakae]